MIISKKVLIKDNCYRNVQITKNGVARWVTKYCGKYVCIRGTICDDVFKADVKYQHIIDAYIPVRNQNKASGTKIRSDRKKYAQERRTLAKQGTQYTALIGNVRRKVFLKYMNYGTISYKGKRINFKIVNGKAICKQGIDIILIPETETKDILTKLRNMNDNRYQSN